MNEIIEIENKKIEDMIYEIRGKQVMLDSDLAKLYGCKNGTKTINLAVKRHINRFPERFMFRLNDDEFENLRFQSETTSNNLNMIRSLPYAFTEQGVAMLATILRTPLAEEVSIKIMDAFVKMRKYISTSDLRISNIETKVLEHDIKINELFNKFDKQINNHIFFEGQIYDAYSLLVDILKQSDESIILIDNYIDKSILDIVSLLEVKVLIITSNYNKNDISKYKEQYDNIEIIHSGRFHDRFIILDYKVLYHCGASFKDLGKRCFAINRINDEKMISDLIEEIYNNHLFTKVIN